MKKEKTRTVTVTSCSKVFRARKIENEVKVEGFIDDSIKLTVKASPEDWIKLRDYVICQEKKFVADFKRCIVFPVVYGEIKRPKYPRRGFTKLMKVQASLLNLFFSHFNSKKWPAYLKKIITNDDTLKRKDRFDLDFIIKAPEVLTAYCMQVIYGADCKSYKINPFYDESKDDFVSFNSRYIVDGLELLKDSEVLHYINSLISRIDLILHIQKSDAGIPYIFKLVYHVNIAMLRGSYTPKMNKKDVTSIFRGYSPLMNKKDVTSIEKVVVSIHNSLLRS